jgi:hypothetical protein
MNFIIDLCEMSNCLELTLLLHALTGSSNREGFCKTVYDQVHDTGDAEENDQTLIRLKEYFNDTIAPCVATSCSLTRTPVTLDEIKNLPKQKVIGLVSQLLSPTQRIIIGNLKLIGIALVVLILSMASIIGYLLYTRP